MFKKYLYNKFDDDTNLRCYEGHQENERIELKRNQI